MSKSLLIMMLTFTFTVDAGLYKGLDEEGNVAYSDKPFTNAEKFTPPAITIVNAPKVIAKKAPAVKEKQVETKYTTFSITSPTNNQTIWNAPQLTVSLKLKPKLNTAEGHTTWLLMDGKPIVKNSQSLSLQIGRSDRGSHTLKAQVKNKKGKILKNTAPITVHIKNTIVTKRPQPTPL